MSYLEDRLKRKNGELPPLPTRKEKKPLAKQSLKKKQELKKEKELRGGGDSEMDLFFEAMLKRCTGKCLFCNSKTTAISHGFFRDDNEKWSQEANDKKYEQEVERMKRASIAHLLPKSKFKSVAVNESNWVELCWQCHTSFDSGKISWLILKDSKEWDILKEKLFIVLPMVAPEERKHKLFSRLIDLVYK